MLYVYIILKYKFRSLRYLHPQDMNNITFTYKKNLIIAWQLTKNSYTQIVPIGELV